MTEEKEITAEQSYFKTICAVIVTFNPDPDRLSLVIQALQPQVNHIYLIDNGSQNNKELMEVLNKNNKIDIIYMEENTGIAHAQNHGIQLALKNKFSYILFMDQDSMPDADMVKELQRAHEGLASNGKRISGVGAVYFNPVNNVQSCFVKFGLLKFDKICCDRPSIDHYESVDLLISAGTLIDSDVVEVVGQMDEALFIDHVDTEWFLRAKNVGYEAFGVCNAKMEHTIGSGHRKFWLFGERTAVTHDPVRYYYMFRNSILLYKKKYAGMKWILADVLLRLKILLFIILFNSRRGIHCKYVFYGIVHGIRGVKGRCNI
jgi:rhamnosyltransferase